MSVARRRPNVGVCGLGLIMLSVGMLRAQSPPSGAADLFVPSILGLTAIDFCIDAGGAPWCRPSGIGDAFGVTESYQSIKADALGNIYLETPQSVQVGTCIVSGTSAPMHEYTLRRLTPAGTVEVIGAFRDECLPTFVRKAYVDALDTDSINGFLYVLVHRSDLDPVQGSIYESMVWTRISGLPTLLDIILSYQPPSTLSFNVPVRPEGLPGADSFSLYAGDVSSASDLSQAVPLQCVVPSVRAPVPGEFLEVPDALPDPAAGDARYYLAAVNYQGQRRAGRSAINGVIQGRNAAALPGCR